MTDIEIQSLEKPGQVLIFGKNYPVEFMVFTKPVPNVGTQKVNSHARIALINYGECDVHFPFEWSAIETPEEQQPIVPFSESL